MGSVDCFTPWDKTPTIPIELEIGWVQNLSGRFGGHKNLLFLTGNRNTIVLTVSAYPGHCTE